MIKVFDVKVMSCFEKKFMVLGVFYGSSLYILNVKGLIKSMMVL